MRLLVRLPNWLGDLLMARPLLHALRASHPAAEVWCVGTSVSRLLERERVWDRWCSVAEAAGSRARPSALRGHSFAAALVLPPSFSSAWMVRRQACARRIGFSGEGRSWLLTHAVRRPAPGETHLSEEYLSLGEPLGLGRAPLPLLRPAPGDLARAAARLGALGVGEGPFLVLGPGAAYGPAKRWGFERFVALARRFTARGWAALVAGSAADRSLAVPMAAAIGPGAHAVAGETMLEEQLALCALARATVSNDSGLAHLAAAAGAATVALFGSTSSAWSAPLGPRVVVVQRAPACSPCFRRTCAIGYRCLEGIAVEAVERAVCSIAA
jgi:heptosyltransferase-2